MNMRPAFTVKAIGLFLVLIGLGVISYTVGSIELYDDLRWNLLVTPLGLVYGLLQQTPDFLYLLTVDRMPSHGFLPAIGSIAMTFVIVLLMYVYSRRATVANTAETGDLV